MGSIVVHRLGKAYKQYPARWSRLLEWLLPSKKKFHSLKWILQDINFTVSPGEAVGIIGINGAGKSTLLKIITGTTRPTTGSVTMSGRVAALLELGMGFHPDFSGRQNVFMAGQLLGYSIDEINRLMPDIENFAEIGDYIDQPVRVYSSGMQVRLAFSVATAIRPDILIVDEALSVGDTYFQHKSFDRIREFRKLGTTLLFVSHDKGAIQGLCDRAILLGAGHVAMEGAPEAVMDFYNAMLADHQNLMIKQVAQDDGRIQTISGNGRAVITKARLLNEENLEVDTIFVGQMVRLNVVVNIAHDLPELVVGYAIKDRLGQPIFGTNTHHLKEQLINLKSGSTFNLTFEFMANLGEGTYSVAIALHAGDSHLDNNYEWRDQALVFRVINVGLSQFVGVAWLPPTMRCLINE